MKYKVLKEFKDLKEDVLRQPGDIFEATVERVKEINDGLAKFCDGCEWIKKVEDAVETELTETEVDVVEQEKPKPTSKKTTTKKE